jgi:hypothetical protein
MGTVKYILLLMYFTTPAAPGPKDEPKKVWTLQSTSQTEFDKSSDCFSIGQQVIAAVEPVGTMTVRAWCLCPNPQDPVCKVQTDNAPRKLFTPKFSAPNETAPEPAVLVPVPAPRTR